MLADDKTSLSIAVIIASETVGPLKEDKPGQSKCIATSTKRTIPPQGTKRSAGSQACPGFRSSACCMTPNFNT